MKCLIPFLQADQYDVLIGGTDDEPIVALTMGPLDAAREVVFRQCVANCL
jgi:hypothetical protein